MYSHIVEFNLSVHGDDADEFLLDAARTWPTLWGSIPGVTGTLLLVNAFALGGDFEYQWRVDIDSLAFFARMDETVKAGEGGWRESRREWFRYRTAVRAHVSSQVAGHERYCQESKETDAAVHAVMHTAPSASGRSEERLEAVRSLSGVASAQTLRPVFGSAASGEQTWLRMDSVERLDDLARIAPEIGGARVFGEMREVAGSLFTGA